MQLLRKQRSYYRYDDVREHGESQKMYLKIYAADTAPLKEQAAYDRLMRLVPEQRRKITMSRKQTDDRAASLAAGLLLSLATERMGLPGADEYIKYNAYGKPYYDLAAYDARTAVRPPRIPQVYFNISHSRDRVMVVLSDMEVGCDVERVRPEAMRLASSAFHPDETAAFEMITDERERQRFFLRRWTIKESYVKAVGTGYTGIMPRSLRVCEEHYDVSIRVCGRPSVFLNEAPENDAAENAATETDDAQEHGPQGGEPDGKKIEDDIEEALSRARLSRFYEWDLYDGYRYACCVLAPDEETLAQLPDEEPELIQIDLTEEF
jgi:4'-phosphopantetheinyl transferase